MTDTQQQKAAVIVALYPGKDDAAMAMAQLKEMAKHHMIELAEAATVYKNFDGKIYVTDTADIGTGKGSRRGLVIGGVVGLVFPPSIVVGALAGGGVGALYGHFRDKGMNRSELEQIGKALEPGQAALIAVVTETFVDQVKAGLEGYSKLESHLLDAEESATVAATKAEMFERHSEA
jgi:uncharacterized membrane protein